MKFVLILTFLIIINPIFSQTDLQTAMDSFLEYYNPKTLKSKPLSKVPWTNSRGDILKIDIDKEIATQILHANYKNYGYIFPGEIIIENNNFIGLTYIIMCAAGGHCEYEKFAIIRANGELITDFEYGKHLASYPEKLIKENVYKSDSLMIFKTSYIELNSPNDSILSIKIDMETIHISGEGEIKVVARNKIDTQRKYYWISTDIAQNSTLAKYSKFELKEIRNEIFASYGYIFKSEKWRNYFEYRKWYKAQFEEVNESLSMIEKMNIEKILRFENDEIYWKKYYQDSIHESNKQDSIRYVIQYPSNWFVKIDSFSTKTSSKVLFIENIKEKVIIAGGGPFTEHGSSFKVAVLITSQGKNIEEFIINGDIPNRVKKLRLEQVKKMEIGGIETLVWVGSGNNSIYEFMYNGRRFRISCMSGSKEQYKIDMLIFQKMVESFKIIE
ncbi:MAG: YARHG domain-containing protein [Candidatus Cloacimonetes bacterium]|nr:YARHG domain-containing protein [Candidatus Cloacimonadota bacterium]